MAEKKSFFSRLVQFTFHRRKAKESAPKAAKPQKNQQPPAKQPQAQHRPQQEKQQLPINDPFVLSLPVDHPLSKLWDLRRSQAGWLPQPVLRLGGKREEPPVFPLAEAEAELTALKSSLTVSATQRLNSATAPQPPDTPGPNLDALPVVYISRDKLTAWLLIYPPVGEGKPAVQSSLFSALTASKVTYGVDQAQIAAIPELAEPYFRLFLVAKGKAPVPGKNGAIEDLFPRVIERKLAVDEFNRVDYTATGATQNIEKDAVICNIIPPTPGEPGRNVLDKPIPTQDGVPAVPPMGRNTTLSEDGSALIAARTGSLQFVGNTFQIHPVLEIEGNVDYSSGSVNFLGDVHIHGDVCSGFTVRAMGNIKVDGVVESGTIEAGGDLVLAKGVLGNNQAVIRANKDIVAKYMENCSVFARGNLTAECIIGCEVYCDSAVYTQSGRGTIIGGKIWAAREVAATIVGSKTEVRTQITLGGLPCEDFEKKVISQEIDDMEKELEEIQRQPDSPVKQNRVSKLRVQLSVDRLKLNQCNKSLEAMQENMDQRSPGRLTFGTAYANTFVEIDGDLMHIRNETRQCSAMLIDGKIKLVS